jgi:hypothetical protein
MASEKDTTKDKRTSDETQLEVMKDYCITNLKILSKIKQLDKLFFENNHFSIDTWNYMQPVTRWYYNESRVSTLRYLEDFVSKVFETIDIIYDSEMKSGISLDNTYYTRISGNSSPVFKEENSALILTFINEMKNCIDGLNNLKQTYKEDISTVSSIDLIIEKMNVRIKKMSSILSIDRNTNPIETKKIHHTQTQHKDKKEKDNIN